MSPALRWKLAQRNGVSLTKGAENIPLSSLAEVEEAYKHIRGRIGANSVEGRHCLSFFEAYYGGFDLLQTEQDYYDLAMGYFEQASHSAKEQYTSAIPYKDMIIGVGLDSDGFERPPAMFEDIKIKIASDDPAYMEDNWVLHNLLMLRERDEIPARTGVWFAGNSCGGFIASLLAYGIGQIKEPLHPWQWMFLSIAIFFFLPNTISHAELLTEEEKQYAEDCVVTGGTGRTEPINSQWKIEQVFECLRDPKTYFFAVISILTQIPNGGTGSFGNLALKSFGFMSLQSTLVTLPASVISMTIILTTGWLASRYRNITTFLIIAVVIPPVVGSALIFSEKVKGVRLFAYYCPSAISLALGLVSSNYKGVTKRMAVTAVPFLTYCAGNIAGPQTFISSEAKSGYPTAFKAIVICYGFVMIISLSFRLYLTLANRSRDKKEGAATVEQPAIPGKVELTAEDYEDITDFKTPGFRYRM
ncbi:hypothetical protein G7Y89_g848 [Cudoniella acicularis]|uniref:Uncharacterized protein n=1 Tax=Cudoniella acicularis TaxID=354080 RepID=A0A8H4RXF0_9HELO|nr:hypothetical protein G7Y89_g848 [Cudoniella acicularis]